MREFEYDEEGTSSYFFVLSLLVLYLTGATIWRLCVWWAGDDEEEDSQIEKRKERKAKNKKGSSLFSTWNIIYALAWIALIAIMWRISHMEIEEVYDPFDILGLPTDATNREIKKKYRELSLIYHPDRNPDDPDADQVFVRISKAYKALTDEKTRQNWERYGNPDGPTTQTYGIALPAWMVQGKQSALVMLAYAVGFIIVIPAIVRSRWTKSKKYLRKDVLTDTARLFVNSLNTELIKESGMMEILSCAVEFQENLKTSKEELTEIMQLLKSVPEMPNNPWQKPKGSKEKGIKLKDSPHAVKARVLMYAHMHRLSLSPEMVADLDFVLEQAPSLINVLAEISFERRWLRPMMLALQVKQMLTQAVPAVDNVGQLEQLPHVTASMLDQLEKKNIKTIRSLVQRTDSKLRSVLSKTPETHVDDVLEFANVFPVLDVDWGLPGAEEDEKRDKSGNRIVSAGMQWAIMVRVRLVSRDELQSSTATNGNGTARKGAAKGGQRGSAARKPTKDSANGKSTPSSKKGKKKGRKGSEAEAAAEADTWSDADAGSSGSGSDGEGSEEEVDEEELWAGVKKPGEDVDDTAPLHVHCPRYPHEKKAQWWCFASDATKKKVVSGLIKLDQLGSSETMRPLPMEKVDAGLKAFNLHVVCDSYLGGDVTLPFKVKAKRPKLPSRAEIEAQRRKQAEEEMVEEEEEDEFDEDDDDEDF